MAADDRSLDSLLRAELREWEAAGLRRELADDAVAAPWPPCGDFRSNDYLGLARDERVIAAARAALEESGAGSRAARLLGGGSPHAARAERDLADWLGAQQSLLFPSGYQANLGLIGTLAGRGDALFSDERNHASLIDGCRLARARTFVFRHGDLDELARQLELARGAKRRLVVTESIFGMDGDLAPLLELHQLCERHDAWLVLDEAHALGLLGPRGDGAWAAIAAPIGRGSRLAARMVTGGKALGVAGAFVACGEPLRDLLLQRARAFVFTTAPPPAVSGALVAAIEVARAADAARARTLELARRLARALGELQPAGARTGAPAAAIVPLPIGDARAVVAIARELEQAGFAAGAVRPPTVPEGGSRLRLVAHAFNDEAGVDELARRIRGAVAAMERRAATEAASLVAPAAGALDSDGRRGPPGAPLPQPHATTWCVVGTDTGVGKTVVCALLLRAARRLGPATYWKPVQTGTEDDAATVRALAGASGDEILGNAYAFPLPASPHHAAAAAGTSIDPDRLALPGDPALRTIVELAGGLLVPLRAGERPFLQSDWLERERPRVVLVARAGLGTLNHTLLTLEALRARHLEPSALFLVGEPHARNVATLRELAGIARVLAVPPLVPLATAALDAWLATHDLRGLLDVHRA